jgi:molybdopterin/thiamine biosynthesis adenylyltransferase
LLDGAFAAAIVHPTGWIAAEVDHHGRLHAVGRVQAVGRALRTLDPPEPVVRRTAGDLDARQADALGAAHGVLRGLRVGVVGAGGLGSPADEALARMGIEEITIIDDDRLDTPSNARRVFGSTSADLQAAEPPLKVDVVGRHLDTIDLGSGVRRIAGDVRTERVFREMLDCDVVLCTTDTHGSRAVLVDLAYAYGVPVLDVGVRAGARDGALAALAAEVRVLTPARATSSATTAAPSRAWSR